MFLAFIRATMNRIPAYRTSRNNAREKFGQVIAVNAGALFCVAADHLFKNIQKILDDSLA